MMRVRQTAVDIMDNACLGERYHKNGVYTALVSDIENAILAERQRHTEVIEAAAALLDGTVTMEITLETDEKIQRLSMALHAARHP